MTKLLPLSSIERGIRRAFGILGDDGVEAAISDHLGFHRSASLIRKSSDPDDERHHLQMRYAIALDRACYAAVRQAPLLDAHSELVRTREADRQPTAGIPSESEIVGAVVNLQAALGDLAHLVAHAYSSESADPSTLTAAELGHLVEAIEALDQHAALLKARLLND